MNIHPIFKNIQQWVKNKLELDPEYFKILSAGQNPDVLYIGCSDSRVIISRSFCNSVLFIIMTLSLFSCAIQKQVLTYNYTDQNNNQYSISASEIRYRPIEPSESSSGTYSGGEKITLKISSEAFNEISNKADALLLTSNDFTSARKMLTAIISVTKAGKTTKGLLNPSEERTQFEILLKKALH